MGEKQNSNTEENDFLEYNSEILSSFGLLLKLTKLDEQVCKPKEIDGKLVNSFVGRHNKLW